MSEQTQPFDREAERAVIAAVLLSPESLPVIRDSVGAAQFFDTNCRLIFEAACAVDDSGSKLDAITVSCAMRSKGTLESIGGNAALRELFNASPDLSHVAEHCTIVSAKARQRAVSAVCRKHLSTSCGELESIESYCEEVERDILAATDPGERGDSPQTVGEVLVDILPAITARQDPNNKPSVVGISTGIFELDAAIDGGLDNAVYYVGARPGCGKTSFAASVMLNTARGDKDRDGKLIGNGKAGVFCSFEMPKDQLAMRLLANESGVDYKAIRSQRMDPKQWQMLLAGADRLSRMPISLHYMAGMHMSKIRTTLKREYRRLERKFGAKPGLNAVDYIGLVKGDRPKGDSRENEIASISRFLTRLPKEFNCPTMGLCQLNRDLEKRPNKRPMMSDLRESGALEQDAYGLWFLYRDWIYNPEGGDEKAVELIMAKNRNGTTGTINVRFDGPLTRFSSENQALYDQCDEIDAGIGGEDF